MKTSAGYGGPGLDPRADEPPDSVWVAAVLEPGGRLPGSVAPALPHWLGGGRWRTGPHHRGADLAAFLGRSRRRARCAGGVRLAAGRWADRGPQPTRAPAVLLVRTAVQVAGRP